MAFELVAEDEAEQLSIVQEIMLRSTDCFEAYHRASWRSRTVKLVPELQQFPSGRLRLVGLWGKPQSSGAQIVEKSTTGGNRTGFWSCKLGKVLRAGQGIRSACGTSGLVRKLDQCAEIAGE